MKPKPYVVEVQVTTAVLVHASSEEQAKRIALHQVLGENKVVVAVHDGRGKVV